MCGGKTFKKKIALHSEILETQELFLRPYFTHKTPRMHICPCARLLEQSRKFGFRPILGRWRSILWRFSAILHFGATEPDLPAFILHLLEELHFLKRILWACEKSCNFGSWKVTRFSWNPTIPLLLHPVLAQTISISEENMLTRGGHLSGGSLSVTFVCPPVPELTQCNMLY